MKATLISGRFLENFNVLFIFIGDGDERHSSLLHYVNSPLARERIWEVTEFKFFVVGLFSTRNVLVISWL